MLLTRKHLSRRTFLRGVGVALGLPLLDAMLPAFCTAQDVARITPKRLAFVYAPNGMVMQNWTPRAVGADFILTPILRPLEPFRNSLVVLSGLMDQNANALGDGDGDHARAGASFLTGVHPRKTGGDDIRTGISADQVAAQAIGRATRLPSLELSLDDNRQVSHCDVNYTCAYTNNISWSSPTTPRPPETNPRAVFDRLFGNHAAPTDPAIRTRQNLYRRSILDSTLAESQTLTAELGPVDRRKMDEYLSSVREIERRIQGAEREGPLARATTPRPVGIPERFEDQAKLMFDMLALAFQIDATRIATFMIGREASLRTYEELGISDPHHPLSHHRNYPEPLAKLTRINTCHVELFAYFLDKLQHTIEAEGSVLDHSMIVYGCGIADSNLHTHEDLPILLAGGGAGVGTGRHVRYARPTPVTNLFMGLLDRMEVRPVSIGDSTGRLEM